MINVKENKAGVHVVRDEYGLKLGEIHGIMFTPSKKQVPVTVLELRGIANWLELKNPS